MVATSPAATSEQLSSTSIWMCRSYTASTTVVYQQRSEESPATWHVSDILVTHVAITADINRQNVAVLKFKRYSRHADTVYIVAGISGV